MSGLWRRAAGAVGLGELLILSLLRLASYYIDFVYVSDSDDHEICSILKGFSHWAHYLDII